MMAKNFWQKIFVVPESDNLEDIRRDIITSILALMGVIAWLTLWAALHYKQSGYFWATVVLIAGILGGIRLRAFHSRAALYVINISFIGTIARSLRSCSRRDLVSLYAVCIQCRTISS